MSDRIRKRFGLLLMPAALLIALVPLFSPQKTAAQHYRSGNGGPWILKEIRFESDGKIPVNTADSETLQKLPGIGPAYAEEIIRERETHGTFYYPEDLEAIRGIGPKTLERIRTEINLTPEKGGE